MAARRETPPALDQFSEDFLANPCFAQNEDGDIRIGSHDRHAVKTFQLLIDKHGGREKTLVLWRGVGSNRSKCRENCRRSPALNDDDGTAGAGTISPSFSSTRSPTDRRRNATPLPSPTVSGHIIAHRHQRAVAAAKSPAPRSPHEKAEVLTPDGRVIDFQRRSRPPDQQLTARRKQVRARGLSCMNNEFKLTISANFNGCWACCHQNRRSQTYDKTGVVGQSHQPSRDLLRGAIVYGKRNARLLLRWFGDPSSRARRSLSYWTATASTAAIPGIAGRRCGLGGTVASAGEGTDWKRGLARELCRKDRLTRRKLIL